MILKLRAAFGAAAIACALMSGLPALAQTQILSSQAFLKGQNAQVGVRPNGAFGSTSVPAGFANNVGSCLGFVVSRDSNGFGGGNQIDGDFFCPGSPFEGWALTVNGTTGLNSDGATDIAGGVGTLVVGPPTHSVTWTSAAPFNGISVAQTYSISDTGQTLNISVTLTNTTGATINGVQYGRFVDPDNHTQPLDPYTSTNTIIGQGASAQVRSTFPNGALIALSSTDPRATVAFKTGGLITPAAVIAGTGWTNTLNATNTADTQTGLAIDVGSIAAGASETFTLSYPLTAAAAGASPTPVPTMSNWAMILLGLILAGGAALYIQRRQMAV